mgnify:FL=1
MSSWIWIGAAITVYLLYRRIAVTSTSSAATGYKAGQSFAIKLVEIEPGVSLAEAPADAFVKMRAAAASIGIELHVNSGYRTMVQQERLYAAYQAGAGNLAARPGYSNHQAGEAVDISGTEGGTGALYWWLEANAARYGWKRTVKSEPWHWEYRA